MKLEDLRKQDAQLEQKALEIQKSGNLNPNLKWYVECNYELPYPSFKRSQVHGRLATLFRVKDKKHCVALQEVAAGKLSYVVIDNSKTGTELLKANAFRSRVVFIPVNEIVTKVPDQETVDYYH